MHRQIPFYLITLFLAVSLLTGCVTTGRPWEYRDLRQTAKAEPSQLSDILSRVMGAETPPPPANQSTPGFENNPLDAQSAQYVPPPVQVAPLAPVKVAILLPLSGQHARLGKSMLNAANMALFDIGHENFEILPRDTGGTPDGARIAAQSAIQDGAQLILGPVFAPSVRAVKSVTRKSGVNMIAFSTDWTLSDGQTFVMGFLPFDQVQRIVDFASTQGLQNIGVIAPSSDYGAAVISAYRSLARRGNIFTTEIYTFAPESPNLAPDLRVFTQYDERVELINQEIRPLQAHLELNPEDEEAITQLEWLEKSAILETSPFDAVLMPVGGDQARAVANLLSHYDLPPSVVRRLGTGLLDDRGLTSEPSLDGAWFAAPSPTARESFIRRFKMVYGESPLRLASLSYDATALAAILAQNGLRQTGQPNFSRAAISNPNGFAGIDGIFRFRSDGIVERGLAVLAYKNGNIVVIDEAPNTFQTY